VLPIIAINLLFGFSVKVVDNAAHIGGLLSGIALALVVPYKRPRERMTPLAWRTLQVICLGIILFSFVSAFSNYSGPRMSLSNLTTRPGSSVVKYLEHMKEANLALDESIKSFAPMDRGFADLKSASDSVARGLRAINSTPRVDPQAAQYSRRLLELLIQQKSLLDEFGKNGSNDSSTLRQEEAVLVSRHRQFNAEYNQWLPGFLKEHGLRVRETENH
jgi:hypothetical protein